MNTPPFIDKQIMDLSSSQNKNNADKFHGSEQPTPHDDDQQDVAVGCNDKVDEFLLSYDFQQICLVVSSQSSNFESNNNIGARVWASDESKTNFGTQLSRYPNFFFSCCFRFYPV